MNALSWFLVGVAGGLLANGIGVGILSLVVWRWRRRSSLRIHTKERRQMMIKDGHL